YASWAAVCDAALQQYIVKLNAWAIPRVIMEQTAAHGPETRYGALATEHAPDHYGCVTVIFKRHLLDNAVFFRGDSAWVAEHYSLPNRGLNVTDVPEESVDEIADIVRERYATPSALEDLLIAGSLTRSHYARKPNGDAPRCVDMLRTRFGMIEVHIHEPMT